MLIHVAMVVKLIKPATLHWSIGPKMMDPEVSGKNPTLPETNSSPLKMDGLNTTFLLGRPIFRGYVSFREGKLVSLFNNLSPFPWFFDKNGPKQRLEHRICRRENRWTS